jgi:hypothetical protein
MEIIVAVLLLIAASIATYYGIKYPIRHTKPGEDPWWWGM